MSNPTLAIKVPDQLESRARSGQSVLLSGCATVPLSAYLKALGVFRLVSEQLDSNARGYWHADGFVLVTNHDASSIERFFLEHYKPTPLVAPWGGRSGFYPGSSESSARAAIEAIEASDDPRLTQFGEAILSVRQLLAGLGFEAKVADEQKLTLLRACRAELPDSVLPWLDACYVLTEDHRAFPPLLGTGGNEGSGSYVSGFAQQIVACIADREHDVSLRTALFGTVLPGTTTDQTPGQFSPLSGGGPNAHAGFEAAPSHNPWDYLLCLEGTLLFAAAVTKRLDASSTSAMSFPFTVRAVGAGAGSVALADEPNARAETWFPLWDEPVTLRELSGVLAEGRVQVNGRTAADALDFARAVCAFGVQRGIVAFERYGYLQRFGRSVIAVPIGRVAVRRNVAGDLATDLDQGEWLLRFRILARKGNAPARLRQLVRRLEDAVFDLTESHDTAGSTQAALVRLGEVQSYLTSSPSLREELGPVPRLRAEWIERASGQESPEFRIATALASVHAIRLVNEGENKRAVLRMAVHLSPVDDQRRWITGRSHLTVPLRGNIEDVAADLAQRRFLAAAAAGVPDTLWSAWYHASLEDIERWLSGPIDRFRVIELMRGIALASIPGSARRIERDDVIVPPAFTVLKQYFMSRADLGRALWMSRAKERADEPGTELSEFIADESTSWNREGAMVARLLAANQTARAIEIGTRRLRVLGASLLSGLNTRSEPFGTSIQGRRLLAALLVPISYKAFSILIRRITEPRESAPPQSESEE